MRSWFAVSVIESGQWEAKGKEPIMADAKAMQDFVDSEAAKTQDAMDDLRRIEQEVAYEAEASVEDYDALGDEQKAAEAAETAFEFEQAQK